MNKYTPKHKLPDSDELIEWEKKPKNSNGEYTVIDDFHAKLDVFRDMGCISKGEAEEIEAIKEKKKLANEAKEKLDIELSKKDDNFEANKKGKV